MGWNCKFLYHFGSSDRERWFYSRCLECQGYHRRSAHQEQRHKKDLNRESHAHLICEHAGNNHNSVPSPGLGFCGLCQEYEGRGWVGHSKDSANRSHTQRLGFCGLCPVCSARMVKSGRVTTMRVAVVATAAFLS